MLTGDGAWQHLAQGFPLGMRFHSALVVRLADAKPMLLGHVQKADARWLLCVFAPSGPVENQIARLDSLCAKLDPTLAAIASTGGDPDALIDVRAVLQASHHDCDITQMPSRLFPAKGTLGLRDYHKVFCPDVRSGDIFDLRVIDRSEGCMVLVRPDQYVSNVLPLSETATLLRQLSAIFPSG